MKYTINNTEMVRDFMDFKYQIKIVFYKNGKFDIFPLDYNKNQENNNKILEIIEIPNIDNYKAIKKLKVYKALQNEIMNKKSNNIEVKFKWAQQRKL